MKIHTAMNDIHYCDPVKGLPGNNEGVGIYGCDDGLVLPGKLKGNP